jgi:cytochrome c oxidase cbb3-type subunit I/II
MVRPFRSETERYGEYSKAGEFVYDHPFLWGSKRTGPDLHRIGGKYLNSWHFRHMWQPSLTSEGSIMPTYQWLYTDDIDMDATAGKITALRKVGVPYAEGFEEIANTALMEQAELIVANLSEDLDQVTLATDDGELVVVPEKQKEIIALIAYLQRLGTDITLKAEDATSQVNTNK